MNDVFVRVKEKQYGPFSNHELRQMARKGGFGPHDEVWNEQDGEWVPAGELDAVRQVFNDRGDSSESKLTRLLAIGGGKGGVGKTVMAASIGVGLASLGKEVVLIDADLGGANLHTIMGILEPERTFFDFFTLGVEDLRDIILPTHVPKLRLISGACGTLGLANPKYQQKLRFTQQLRTIDSDFVILDLGAGSSYNVIDFFLTADEGIVVTNPEPMAIQECFNFIKICLLRRLRLAFRNNEAVTSILEQEDLNRPGRISTTMKQVVDSVRHVDVDAAGMMAAVLESYSPKLILNMVMEKEDIKEGIAIQTAAAELLSIEVDYLGYISYDDNVRNAVREFKPFLLMDSDSPSSQELSKLISVKLLGQKSIFKRFWQPRKMRKQLMAQRSEYPEVNLTQQAPVCSVKCFYWGDCEYQNGGHPCSVRQLEPIFKS